MIQASIYGRLGKDAQSIETRTGKPMTAASIAVDLSPRDGESTVWVRVVAFGAAAEVLAKHGKGDALSAMGRLELSHWRGDDGAERESWQLIAEHLVSARTVRPRGGKATTPPTPGGQTKPSPGPAKATAPLPFNDEIPF